MENSANAISTFEPAYSFASTSTARVQSDMSVNINEIASALSKAQLEFETIDKGEEGYGYNYASLTATIKMTKPVLAKHGLAITQLAGTTNDNRPEITTILMHTSGQFIKSIADMELVEMKGCNSAQRAGAVYSYLRRYALQGILNLSSEDNDASANGFNKSGKTSFSPKKEVKAVNKPARQKFRKTKKVKDEEDDI